MDLLYSGVARGEVASLKSKLCKTTVRVQTPACQWSCKLSIQCRTRPYTPHTISGSTWQSHKVQTTGHLNHLLHSCIKEVLQEIKLNQVVRPGHFLEPENIQSPDIHTFKEDRLVKISCDLCPVCNEVVKDLIHTTFMSAVAVQAEIQIKAL